MLRIDFVTLFPEMVIPAVRHSILQRAQASGAVEFHATNPRDFASDKHRTVDAKPFGGGPGMLMMPEPLDLALSGLDLEDEAEVVFLEPSGTLFDQRTARELAESSRIVLVCGHYEGIDQRILEKYATRILSLGDFVLTGGELPALVVADAVVRLLPKVLGDPCSLEEDSHSDGLLSYPQYTRPRVWEGRAVPEVLVSGDHGSVKDWRRAHAVRQTRERRPDLFCRATLTKKDLDLLQ